MGAPVNAPPDRNDPTGLLVPYDLHLRRLDGGDFRVVDTAGPVPESFRVTVNGGHVAGCDCPHPGECCPHELFVILHRVRTEVPR